jgi:8-oxo-dGTP pyrophosphatase MutT (NUDIX family)
MGSKRKPSKQVAALPLRKRRGGAVDVLLITSRKKGKWLIPKGWPCRGMKDWEAAQKEALEEAGVRGKVSRRPLGRYKRHDRLGTPILVKVFLLRVDQQAKRWAEHHQRRRKWLTPEQAARKVDNLKLGQVLQGLRRRKSVRHD